MGSIVKTKSQQMHAKAVQDAFDFSVLTCYAIETLRIHLDKVEEGKETLVKPYYYSRQNTVPNLKKQVGEFEETLASYMLLSVFSFFETFVKAIVEEFIDFQGGIDSMVARAEKRDKMFILNITKEMSIQRYKLRTKKQYGHEERYKKFTKLLQQQGYRFPTETFSSYGIKRLEDDLSRIKAYSIPDFLINAFHIPLDPKDVKYYHKIRELRNQVAHGKSIKVNLKEISKINDLFRRWTLLINEHMLANHFIIEDYS